MVMLNSYERENRQLNDAVSSLRADKEALEASIYEAQQLLDQLQMRRDHLEAELSKVSAKRDALQIFDAHSISRLKCIYSPENADSAENGGILDTASLSVKRKDFIFIGKVGLAQYHCVRNGLLNMRN
ncbi:unnamed protein product [Protopolystoma xenopodis]|uniref:Uncharacterized protein n=1 Tax=Protopolystoma xenopodis TaxID=117903 RepID=A0A3S5AQQ8_9PLAT|nr:unnamed protein product [Protopolystoma xenopodis]